MPVIAAITSANRPELATAAIRQMQTDTSELQDLFTRTIIAASVLGYWAVKKAIAPPPRQLSKILDSYVPQASPLAFADSLEKLLQDPILIEKARDIVLSKQIMTRRQFDRLDSHAKRQAFTISSTMDDRLILQMRQAVADAIVPGATTKDIERAARAAFRQIGVTPQVGFHAETVFRTVIQTALNDAKYEALLDPEIARQSAYVEYITMEDGNVRPSHRRMHGVVRPISDPVWRIWWPPNGFNCRCIVAVISHAEADSRGLQPTPELPNARPDPGFESGPGRWI